MGGVLGFGSRGSASLGLLRSFPFEFRGASFEIRGVSIRNRGGNGRGGSMCNTGVVRFSIGLTFLHGARFAPPLVLCSGSLSLSLPLSLSLSSIAKMRAFSPLLL